MYFPTRSETGYAVAFYCHALGGNVAVVDCGTLAQATAVAARKNLELAQNRAAVETEAHARTVRRSVRSCLPDLVRV